MGFEDDGHGAGDFPLGWAVREIRDRRIPPGVPVTSFLVVTSHWEIATASSAIGTSVWEIATTGLLSVTGNTPGPDCRARKRACEARRFVIRPPISSGGATPVP